MSRTHHRQDLPGRRLKGATFLAMRAARLIAAGLLAACATTPTIAQQAAAELDCPEDQLTIRRSSKALSSTKSVETVIVEGCGKQAEFQRHCDEGRMPRCR